MSQPYILIPAAGSDPPEEWVRLGVEAQVAGRLADAERHYRTALRLDPQHAAATTNLAVCYAQQGNVNEGLLAAERATIFDPACGPAHANRAMMALAAERVDEALAAARAGVEAAPGQETRLALALTLATAGLAADALPVYDDILRADPAHAVAGMNGCFVQTLTAAGPPELLARRWAWAAAHRPPNLKHRPHHRPLNRPLRVGYVGGDFKCHSAAMIFGRVVLDHDSARVTPYLYSTLPTDPAADGTTKRFMDKAGPNWREVSARTDEEVADQVRADRIDILVDLAAHTNGGRLGVFLRRPAPVQAHGWGFAHGTGLPEVDYFLACPVSVLPQERQYYAEAVVDLPSLVTYLPPEEYRLKGASALPYHANEYVTFGSYARYEKLSTQCLKAFAEVLRRVPGSRLQFKDHGFRRPYSIRRVIREMGDVDPRRLRFSLSTTHPDHLLAYQQADLCLDPFPHGGGVVAVEQLYMGVPLVTLYGPQPSGRQASSVLARMGRQDWIARTPEEYVEKAVALAGDVPTLNRVRKTLRQELLDSPVVRGYCAAVEDAYDAMAEKYDGR